MSSEIHNHLLTCNTKFLLDTDLSKIDLGKGKLNDLLMRELSVEQQQIFTKIRILESTYLDTDYPINLTDVWRWIGFNRKGQSLTAIENRLKVDVDYIVKTTVHEKNIIYLSVKGFLKLCISAATDKSDIMSDYYFKLDKITTEYRGE